MYYYCPCCGWPGLDAPPYRDLDGMCLVRGFAPPYVNHFGLPSYEVCSCCGFEYGNDDDPGWGRPGDSFEQSLGDFVASGCVWFYPRKMPPQWTLEKQLFGLPIKTPATSQGTRTNGGGNG
jgi:hypothetical protein